MCWDLSPLIFLFRILNTHYEFISLNTINKKRSSKCGIYLTFPAVRLAVQARVDNMIFVVYLSSLICIWMYETISRLTALRPVLFTCNAQLINILCLKRTFIHIYPQFVLVLNEDLVFLIILYQSPYRVTIWFTFWLVVKMSGSNF